MKRFFLFLLLCGAVGISAFETDLNSAEKAVMDTLERNLKACNAEDIDAILRDVPDQIREQVRTQHEKLFAAYDLEYKITEAKILFIDDGVAAVKVVQETRKIRGPAFRDNRTKTVQFIRKYPDGWKITNAAFISVVPL